MKSRGINFSNIFSNIFSLTQHIIVSTGGIQHDQLVAPRQNATADHGGTAPQEWPLGGRKRLLCVGKPTGVVIPVQSGKPDTGRAQLTAGQAGESEQHLCPAPPPPQGL